MDNRSYPPSFITHNEAALTALNVMAQHALQPMPGELEQGVRSADDPQPFLVKPPPSDMNIDPAKWAALTRAERRGLVAEHKRVKKAGRRG